MTKISVSKAIECGAFNSIQPKQIKLSENVTKLLNPETGKYVITKHLPNGDIFASQYNAKNELTGLMEVDKYGKIYALDKNAETINIIA